LKKYFSVLSVIFLLLFIGNSMVFCQEVDPTGALGKFTTIQNEGNESALKVLETITLDYHPIYGKVGLRDMPVSTTGFNEEIIPSLFPGKKIESYEIIEENMTGTALIEHQAPDGTRFYVWHQIVDEPMKKIRAKFEDPEIPGMNSTPQSKSMLRVIGIGEVWIIGYCTNGCILVVDRFGRLWWVG
jgi:hypothetical protein